MWRWHARRCYLGNSTPLERKILAHVEFIQVKLDDIRLNTNIKYSRRTVAER